MSKPDMGESDDSKPSVDSILVSLGTMGRYQILQAALVCLSHLTIAFHLFSFVFTAQPVEHWCKTDNRSLPTYNETREHCNIKDTNASTETSHSCSAWDFDKDLQHSIVSEWSLVCDQVVFARLPQSLFIAGQAVGAVIFSAVSDRLGRKPALCAAHFLTGCAGVGLAFSPNILTFSILRFVNGVCQQGVVVTCVALLLEAFPMRRRVEVAATYYTVWSFSTMTMSGVAYLIRHMTWRDQQLVFSSVSMLVILQIIFLSESVRWLITNKKHKNAILVIKKTTKMNKIDISTIPYNTADIPMENVQSNSEKQKAETELSDPKIGNKDIELTEAAEYRFFDLFKSPFLLKMSLVVWFSWLVDALTYFSLYLTASSLAEDPYLNFLFNSMAELPAGPLYWYLGRRFGRRIHFMTFHFLAGVCLLAATGVRSLADGQVAATSATVLAIVGKVGNSACFNNMFIYAPEIYPTNLRTVGIGMGSIAARVGGSMAPFITILADLVPWAPGVIFGSACLIASALNYYLPEPEGRELPQTIEDIQRWKRKISREE